MDPKTPQPANAKKPTGKRRGVVLVAVLIVVASLSLAGYHYIDLMSTEDKGAIYAHRYAQAKAFAESGVHWTAAMLADGDSYNNVLGGNPFNNSAAFPDSGTEIALDGDIKGYFRIMGPPNLDDGTDPKTPVGGVTDEGGKINPNAIMKIDPTGKMLHDMLVKLPNMTEDVANNIVAWMGGSVGIQNGGQTSYPNYRVKNGPLDSIDELLLVQGVMPQLLYGWDTNRNGILDGKEVDDGNGRGWAAYLTVHSREQTCDPFTGMPYVNLNNEDLTQLYADLTNAGVEESLAKYVILAHRYQAAPRVQNAAKTPSADPNTFPDFEAELLKQGTNKFASLFDLIGTQVVKLGKGKDSQTISYPSPLDPAAGDFADKLGKFFAKTTIYTTPEIPARINISTAPMAVFAALPGFEDTDVQKIQQARASADLSSPAWILVDPALTAKLVKVENLITTRTQVYRVQSVGFFGNKGPTVRLEAIIDTNAGRPRILGWRDLTELGKGLP